MNVLSICSGIGMLDLGIHLACPTARTVGYCEREGFAQAILLERMEKQDLDAAPIYEDIQSLDGKPWFGAVDLIASGLPCQPYSVAGKGRGNKDERALFPELVRLVRESRPAAVFFENTPKFLKLSEQLFDNLRSMGYQWAPPFLSTASEYGAPHDRERVFLLAAHPDRLKLRVEQRGIRWPDRKDEALHADSGNQFTNAVEQRLEGIRREHPDQWLPGSCDYEIANEYRKRFREFGCCWTFDQERQTFRHDVNRCGGGCRISKGPWETESPVVRVDAIYPGWVDELRAIGNGVVPLVAATAFRTLFGGVIDELNE